MATNAKYTDTKKRDYFPVDDRDYKKYTTNTKPSKDMPWLQFHRVGAYDISTHMPGVTVWDFVEPKLIAYDNIPLYIYLDQTISRREFIESVYKWASVFKKMGVKKGDVVPIYSPFMPTITAMCMALNILGAIVQFTKMGIPKIDFDTETADAKIAVIFSGLYKDIQESLKAAHFKKILVVEIYDDLKGPKKTLVKTMVKRAMRKEPAQITFNNKFVAATEIYQTADDFEKIDKKAIRAPFKANQPALIAYSSGTSIGGRVKGVMASNENMLANLSQFDTIRHGFAPGEKVFLHLPPFSATALVLFFASLYQGAILELEPRYSKENFYSQVMKSKPQLTLSGAGLWEDFFSKVKPGDDLSFFRNPMIGGEPVTPNDFKRMQKIMDEHGGPKLINGYGQSETFASISFQLSDVPPSTDDKNSKHPIPDVGVILPYMRVGIFDENNKELGYDQRGEVRVQSNAVFLGYYKKPDLSKKALKDGWLHTGDLGAVDKSGRLYVYGRMDDFVEIGKKKNYLFDYNYAMENDPELEYAMVLPYLDDKNNKQLMAHIVFSSEFKGDKLSVLKRINAYVKKKFGKEISAFHEQESGHLPLHPETGKKYKNQMVNSLENYYGVEDGKLINFNFKKDSKNLYHVIDKEIL